MQRVRAFTLIELLVVIAIIAILAAILFPVFAQAKLAAKKVKNLSNQKQLATATLIYTTDYDDTFPLAFTQRTTAAPIGSFRYSTIVPFPADNFKIDTANVSGWNTVGAMSDAGGHVANSVFPYVKSDAMYDDTGFARTIAVAGEDARMAYRYGDNTTWNGLLHGFSATSVTAPSRCPMWYNGFGDGAYLGRTSANPVLNCSSTAAAAIGIGTATCAFNPDAVPQSGGVMTTGSAWFRLGHAYVFGNGFNESRTDSSAKFVKLSTGPRCGATDALCVANTTALITDYFGQPFAKIRDDGFAVSAWVCNINTGGVAYSCYFRPDRDN